MAAQTGTGADVSSGRLGKNILWNYLSGFTSIFGLLLLYPLAVSIVGASSYGLWVLAIGAIQMLSMTDFGLGAGTVRTLAGLPESSEYERRRFVTAVVLVFVLLAGALTLVYLVVFPLYLSSVTIPEQDQAILWPMTLMASGTLFISMVGRGLNSVLWGLNRPDIERKAAVVAIIARALGYGGVLLADGGLLGIVIVECLSLVLPPFVCMVAVARRFRAPIFGPGLWSEQALPLLRLSSVMSIGSLALLGVYQLPLFIVGPTLGLSAATAFGALMRVYQSCRLIVSWIAMPYGYPLKVATGAKASAVLRNCLTLTLGMAMLMGIALVSIPTELMSAWMGDDFTFAAFGLAVLALGLFAEALNQPSNLVLTLKGSPLQASLLSLSILVLTAPAVWVATRTHEITWVALATVAPSALLSIAHVALASRVLPLRAQRADVLRLSLMVGGAVFFTGVAVLIAQFLPVWPTVLLVAAGLALMALRMIRMVRSDHGVLDERQAEGRAPAEAGGLPA